MGGGRGMGAGRAPGGRQECARKSLYVGDVWTWVLWLTVASLGNWDVHRRCRSGHVRKRTRLILYRSKDGKNESERKDWSRSSAVYMSARTTSFPPSSVIHLPRLSSHR